jgi:hypothetical protein
MFVYCICIKFLVFSDATIEYKACAGILEQYMRARNRVGIGLSDWPASAGIFKQSMVARNQVGIGLSYPPSRARICKRLWSPEIDSDE